MSEREPVDPAEVHHVAGLARIDLADDEVDEFASQFADILAYFDRLDEVPAVESEPDLVNVMREDVPEEGLEQSAALSNAPETEEGYFKGPPVG